MTAADVPAPDLTVDELARVSRPAVDIAADVREEAAARAIADALDGVPFSGREWQQAFDEGVRGMYRQAARAALAAAARPPAQADETAAAVEPSPYVEAWLASADRGSLVAECRRLSDVALHNLARAQTAEAALRALDGSR